MGSPSSSFLYGLDVDDEDEVISTAVQLLNEPVPRPIVQRRHIERDRNSANNSLMADYFSDNPLYTDEQFKTRFRISRRLFLRIARDLEEHNPYFRQRYDATGKLGFTAIQKCTSAIRILAYGNTTDMNDEYLKMAEKTTRDTVEEFCKGLADLYTMRYLRKPTMHDMHNLYERHEEVHRLPGMIGSIDCMHWTWDNCPTAWRGHHSRGDQKGPTVILQAVCSNDRWIWYAKCNVAGSLNDINVLEGSSVIEDYVADKMVKLGFYANGNYYPHGYLLGDGIYPEYSMIVKTFRDPIDEKRRYFKKVQESARKDIECCFGNLKKKWHFLKNPCRLMTKDKMEDCMRAIILMHNMNKEDKGHAICADFRPEHIQEMPLATNEKRIANIHMLRSSEIHNALKADLVENTWITRPANYVPEPVVDQDDEENEEDYDDVQDDD